MECVLSVDWKRAEKALAEACVSYVRDSGQDDFLFQVLRAMDTGAADVLLETLDQFSESEKLAMLSEFFLTHASWVDEMIRGFLGQIGVAEEVQAEMVRVRPGENGTMILNVGNTQCASGRTDPQTGSAGVDRPAGMDLQNALRYWRHCGKAGAEHSGKPRGS